MSQRTESEVLENAKAMCGVYRPPTLVISKGQGPFLWDIDGKKYIDFFAGIAVTSLGHCEPTVNKIIADQSSTLLHCSNALANPYAPTLCKAIVEKTKEFGGMFNAAGVFLSNSGAECNEAALKFARKFGQHISPDKTEIIAFESSFHGRTFGALSVTANPHYREPFEPLVPGIKRAVVGDIASVENVISAKTCAVIIEPIQGEGGIHPVDHDFLIQLKKLCQKHRSLLIFDEVQCGVGRSGTLWVHSKLPKEAHPDIFTSAKAIANGFPLAATVMTEEVSSVLKPGDHGSTFGGNPVGCRVALHVLDTIGNADFLQAVKDKSQIFREEFGKIAKKFPKRISEVRGDGLMLGVALTEDPKQILAKARDLGLILSTAGGTVLRVTPALNIPDEVIREGCAILEKVLEEVPPEK